MSILKLENIFKSFGALTVLNDISLDLREGEIVAVVGPSGAGKSTLLQVAGTLSRPDSGRIIYRGTDITGWKDSKISSFRNQSIGFVFQFHQLLSEFSAIENVMLPALIAGKAKREAHDEAMYLLEILGVEARASHKPGQLSGGEKQRVAIARALINKPAIVFADEPTGSLDSRNRDEIRRLIAEMRGRLGQSFMIVTHDPTVASIADRILTITDGKIKEQLSEQYEPEIEVDSETKCKNLHTE